MRHMIRSIWSLLGDGDCFGEDCTNGDGYGDGYGTGIGEVELYNVDVPVSLGLGYDSQGQDGGDWASPRMSTVYHSSGSGSDGFGTGTIGALSAAAIRPLTTTF